MMMGRRRRAGLVRAAATVALAMALLGPGPLVSPSPGGDPGSRSSPTQGTLFMVDVLDVTCLGYLGGRIVTGTAGGGIVLWSQSGETVSLFSTPSYLPSNHIVDMVTDNDWPWILAGHGSEWMITYPAITLPDGPTYAYRPLDEIANATAIEQGGYEMVILAKDGSLFRFDHTLWVEADLPAGVPNSGWTMADVTDDLLAISNGTNVTVVDLEDGTYSVIDTPPIHDLDLRGDALAIASEGHPDVFNITSGRWLNTSITSLLDGYGKDWTGVVLGPGGVVHAAAADGSLASLEIASDDDHLFFDADELRGWVDGVRDLLPLPTGELLVATANGTWVLNDGALSPLAVGPVSCPPSNDIRSVSFEADTLWALTEEGVSFLTFDSLGRPASWHMGPDLGDGANMGNLETAYLEGTVYICGYGPGIHTYDTFASSATSRWDRAHLYGDARDDVRDVLVVNGTLYTGGAYGLDRKMPGSDPPTFEMVPGAPEGVLSLMGYMDRTIYVGTESGLWSYDTSDGTWKGPGQHPSSIPQEPVTDLATNGPLIEVAVSDTLYGYFMGSGEETVLIEGTDITRVDSRFGIEEPFWVAVGGKALMYRNEISGHSEPEREGLGDAWVHDLSFAQDGTVYLATDSGLHRIDRFGTVWKEWTTSDGLSANDIRTLEVVPGAADLWVGAYGGIDIMDTDTERVMRIGVEDGIPSNLVYDIEMEGDDVWIGTDVGGAAKADRGDLVWQSYNMSSGLIAEDVQAVGVWNDHVLFGTDEGVTVLNRSSSTFESYTATSSDLPNDWIWCVLPVEDGFFVGTDGGVAHLDPMMGVWTSFPDDRISGLRVRSLLMVSGGTLWMGTTDGLHVVFFGLDHEILDIARIDWSDGLPGNEVLAMDRASSGDILVGTSAGLAVLDWTEQVKATFTTLDGLIHDRVAAIEEGPEGTFWLGTAGGLSRLTMDSWDLLPQWAASSEDIPDVYIALDTVVVDPEEPSGGDPVNISLSVSNPSGKRAIVHVGLFADDGGSPGDEISSGIAYTEPGGTYKVMLSWTAVGGEQSLWIVADPDDLVPESNERNNVVALSIHVNHKPEILDLRVSEPRGNDDLPEQTAMVQFNFTYRDLDGDRPISSSVGVLGMPGASEITLRGGDPKEGVLLWGSVDVPVGNSTMVIDVSDGRVATNVSYDVSANFAVTVHGLERGRRDDGKIRFTVSVVGPWEGDTIEGVSVRLVEPGMDPNDPEDWDAGLLHSASRVGDGWEYLAYRQDPGKYDVWVLAMDDRLIEALYVEEDVIIQEMDEGDALDWIPLAFAVIIVIAIITIFISLNRGRSRG